MAPTPPMQGEPASAAFFAAKQSWPSCEDAEALEGGAPFGRVAEAFLAALRTPVMLEWRAMLEDGTCAVMSAELNAANPSASKWPPTKCSLKLIPARSQAEYTELGLIVPTSASAAQLAEFMRAANCGNDAKQTNSSLEAAVEPLPIVLASLPRIAVDEEQRIFQPQCLEQWHHDICGHHALFNARCLLFGEVERLQDSQAFCQSVLRGVAELAQHGDDSKRWPRSRVMGGIADGVHLRHLVDVDSRLCDRVTVVETSDALSQKLSDPEAEVRKAMDIIAAGQGAHAFLLGATTHWYAAVAVGAPSEKGGLQLWLCDSYNKPLARLRSDEDVEEALETRMNIRRSNKRQLMRQSPEWMHRPEEHIDAAIQDGVQEWWKGILKSSLFWREKPMELQRQLLRQELQDVRAYMNILISAMKLPHDSSEG